MLSWTTNKNVTGCTNERDLDDSNIVTELWWNIRLADHCI